MFNQDLKILQVLRGFPAAPEVAFDRGGDGGHQPAPVVVHAGVVAGEVGGAVVVAIGIDRDADAREHESDHGGV